MGSGDRKRHQAHQPTNPGYGTGKELHQAVGGTNKYSARQVYALRQANSTGGSCGSGGSGNGRANKTAMLADTGRVPRRYVETLCDGYGAD